MSRVGWLIIVGAVRTHRRRYGLSSAIVSAPTYIAAMRRAHAYLRSSS